MKKLIEKIPFSYFVIAIIASVGIAGVSVATSDVRWSASADYDPVYYGPDDSDPRLSQVHVQGLREQDPEHDRDCICCC